MKTGQCHYIIALCILAVLKTRGVNYQITYGIHISDLLGDTALAVAAGLCCWLGWSIARTQDMTEALNATKDAVTVAAFFVTLAGSSTDLRADGAGGPGRKDAGDGQDVRMRAVMRIIWSCMTARRFLGW
jgi:hypothetical protein